MELRTSNFVVLANRLPVDRVTEPDGSATWRRSPGGLVTALAPVMREHDGAWIGWAGVADEAPEPFHENGMDLVAVDLSAQDIELYYEGFSNGTLWPLYHDVIVAPEYHRPWWEAYVRVNERFAEAAARHAAPGAVVWVQDYQLQLVPQMLRDRRPDLRIGFFLHIPFPPSELFAQLPWRQQIMEGLLGADLVGFQRAGAVTNFLELSRRLLGLSAEGSSVRTDDGRLVRAGAYPISIDAAELDDLARSPDVEKRALEMRQELGDPATVLLGVDRLDYTKGIGHRLRAYEELLASETISAEQTVLVQVATPSRERVNSYQALRDDIELQVGRINGDYGRLGHHPVHYLHTTYNREDLAALYRATDVMLVTPLRDGMNLVAKEYIACRYDLGGALVLSEFAGAADELHDAFLVNPHDIDGMSRVIMSAIRADVEDASARMASLRRQVFSHDVARWANDFLDTLTQA